MKCYKLFCESADEVQNDLNELHDKYKNVASLYVSNRKYPDSLHLHEIIVNKEHRNTGIGSKIMKDLTDIADKHNKRISLSPSNDFGGAVGRLKEFYKRFGFYENKGRRKNYQYTETMLRIPNGQ
jgi:ribosomal protein S18 acetylase RimI-like enzyme